MISLYQAHVEGFDFKLIAGGATNVKAKNESHAIQVGKSSAIKTAKDLEGKTVAVNTLNNIVHLMAMDWANREHRRILELEGLRAWIAPDLDGYADVFDAVEEQGIAARW